MFKISVWHGDLSDEYLRYVTQLGVDCLDFGSGNYFPGVEEQGYPDLDEVLKRFGVQNIVITGTLTNICCESTARDGMMIGYHAVMVSDANASRTDEDHISGLISIYQCFGDVRTTDEVLSELMPLESAPSQAAE